ncbi:MAG: phosphoglycerate dehydrogenase [Candidatus Omnitrophica bacterium]|nr:phosphoglycerate dehydrogenase [Candidatus Omnitrophota bacterium]
MKVLVADRLEKDGLAVLEKEKGLETDVKLGLKPEALKEIVGAYDAVIVRSGTRLTKDIIEAAGNLKVIGRAGVGVDNVDLEAATKRGIIVMNTPEGNTTATAELTMTMILALARKVPQAYLSITQGKWQRSEFMGTELNGKTLGVVGMGRIGREVARRASQGFGMKVLGYDPFITEDSVKQFPVTFCDLKKLFRQADFITVHTPLTPETKHLVDEKAFEIMKPGVRVINCARGGIIDEKALLKAIKSGKVAGCALDVFEKEPPGNHPLLKCPEVIATPHLGAATHEAQENVSVAVAHQVIDALKNRAIRNAVNLPSLDPETYRVLRPWIVLAERLGLLHTQLFGGKLREVTVRYCGEVTQYPVASLTIAVLKGLLAPICGPQVNFVNAPALAQERGIVVNESKTTEAKDFANFIEIETGANHEKNRMMGILFGNQEPRLVKINEFLLDAEPKGYMLFIHNEDRPGVVGNLGTILGRNSVNIAEMTLGRIKKQNKTMALTVINTDQEVPAKVLAEIKKLAPIIDVKLVKL